LKVAIALLILILLLFAYFFYQGKVSATKAPPLLSGNTLSVCGSKPNCVSSLQDSTDDHYIEPIELGTTEDKANKVVTVIESLGGEVTSSDGKIDADKLQVRSSSRVGHSDLGANRKRIELLRQALL